jgi:protein SCO1
MTRCSRNFRKIAFFAAALCCGIVMALRGAQAAAIPGIEDHFALETTSGHAVTQASFPGKWLLVYFGYTHCPDACPTALSAMAAALDKLGPLADRVQPLFITVDPQRDTPAVLAKYVGIFDPRIVGLYGTAEETDAAAKAFRVYHTTRILGHGDYTIDHSAFIYVVDPGGRVVELLTGNLPGRTIAAALRDAMK